MPSLLFMPINVLNIYTNFFLQSSRFTNVIVQTCLALNVSHHAAAHTQMNFHATDRDAKENSNSFGVYLTNWCVLFVLFSLICEWNTYLSVYILEFCCVDTYLSWTARGTTSSWPLCWMEPLLWMLHFFSSVRPAAYVLVLLAAFC